MCENFNICFGKFNELKSTVHLLKDKVESLGNTQKDIQDLVRSVDKLAINMSHMLEEQKIQREEINELKEAPAKAFGKYKTALVTGVITTVIGMLIGAVFSLFIK